MISPARILGQPNPRPNARGLQQSVSNNSPLRKKSTDGDMVDRYWQKVKAKFGQMASSRAGASNNSNQSLSRHRSLSPYDPEGNHSQNRLRFKEAQPQQSRNDSSPNYTMH